MRTVSALILLALLASASIGQDKDQARGWAWAGIAASTLEHQSKPTPKPDKTPGSVCPSCQGSGKVGDGQVFATCLDCNGTGVVPARSVGVLQGVVSQILGSNDCPDGRCDLLKGPRPAALPSPQVQLPSSPCPGGICPAPSSPQRVYRPPQPQTMRRGWIFRR
jgi:hypothetical protein